MLFHLLFSKEGSCCTLPCAELWAQLHELSALFLWVAANQFEFPEELWNVDWVNLKWFLDTAFVACDGLQVLKNCHLLTLWCCKNTWLICTGSCRSGTNLLRAEDLRLPLLANRYQQAWPPPRNFPTKPTSSIQPLQPLEMGSRRISLHTDPAGSSCTSPRLEPVGIGHRSAWVSYPRVGAPLLSDQLLTLNSSVSWAFCDQMWWWPKSSRWRH